MDASTCSHQSDGGHLKAVDATEDAFENVVQTVKAADFNDWPNEAGFEGLSEVRGPINLIIKGDIPAWAAGTLYRTGPGQFEIRDTPLGTHRVTHWFDGFAQTHKFNIVADTENPNGVVQVEYSSRYQSEKYVEEIRKTGRLGHLSFGQRQDPCIGLFGKAMSSWNRTFLKPQGPSSQNVCVVVHADVPGLTSNESQMGKQGPAGHRGGSKGSIWISTDANVMKEVSRETLEPLGTAKQRQLDPLLKGPLSCAHAQRDPETGDFFNYNLDMGRIATYRVFRTNASTGTTDILATISGPDVKPAYIHSFFLSPSFVILCIPSSHLAYMGLSVPWKGNIVDAIEPFNQSKTCKWFVIDRRGDRGVVGTFDSSAGFFFHSVNAFEERSDSTGDINVFCDSIEYPSTDLIRALEMDVLLQRNDAAKNFYGDDERARNTFARLRRYKLRLPGIVKDHNKTVRRGVADKVLEIKAPLVGDLPTINPACATKRYRYVYSLAFNGRSTLFDSLEKTDLATQTSKRWNGPKGHTPGEAIFVPRPKQGADDCRNVKADDEDDGVLLSVVLDGFGKKSYLLCLDAKTMEELGRADCDFAIAFGFHGMHQSVPARVVTQDDERSDGDGGADIEKGC